MRQQEQRTILLNHQHRSYVEGTVEYINDQWIFFDSETDEASSIEDYINQKIEIFRGRQWRSGTVYENGIISMGMNKQTFFLQDDEAIKIRKQLIYSFEKLLDTLNDDSFVQFVTSLNSLGFSIYDCIYSYNQLEFSTEASPKSGVNFLIFDNSTHICSVQHSFFYAEKNHDRFEFTLNTGKKIMIEKINSKHP